MKVTIMDKKLGKIINDKNKLIKRYGPKDAELITKRLDQLKSMDSLGMMIKFKIGRCHSLKGDLKGKYALDLNHPDRLIIKPIFEPKMDLSHVDFFSIKEVAVLEVKDYHGK